jgi:hypothetical protein
MAIVDRVVGDCPGRDGVVSGKTLLRGCKRCLHLTRVHLPARGKTVVCLEQSLPSAAFKTPARTA